MNSKVSDIIYRLCALAEFYHWETECQSEGKGKKSKVFYGDQDDPEWCSDEWTMYEEDYDKIMIVKEALEEKYKDLVTFVLPLEGKNLEAIENFKKLRENKSEIELYWPMPEDKN